jgi:hypothetical protein
MTGTAIGVVHTVVQMHHGYISPYHRMRGVTMASERGGDLVSFTVRLPPEEHRALKTYAAVTGSSVNEAVTAAVREYLAGPGRREQFETLLGQAREDFRAALDKLA